MKAGVLIALYTLAIAIAIGVGCHGINAGIYTPAFVIQYLTVV